MTTTAGLGRALRLRALTVAALAVVLLLTFLPPTEPIRKGKPLNYWLDQVLTTNRPEAEIAIHEFGTNIVPILQAKLKSEHSMVRTWYRKNWAALPMALQHGLRAPLPIEEAQEPIYRALRALGPAVVPCMTEWLQHRDKYVRFIAILVIRELGPAARDAVPALAKLANDPDADVGVEAIVALGQVGRGSLEAIPALMNVVRNRANTPNARGNAAWALSQIGPDARVAVPVLAELSDCTNFYARVQAEIALWRLDGDTNMIPRLVSELENAPHVSICPSILVAINGSKSAVRWIIQRIKSPDWKGQFGREILEDLHRMNPKAVEDIANEPGNDLSAPPM